MEECKYQNQCKNFGKACFKCFNYNLYDSFKEIKPLQNKSSSRKEKKEGADFEKSGVKKYNQSIKISKDMARKQLASGALPFALGDMITEEELTSCIAEFKERGDLSSSGQKQITIKKEWLDKLKKEAVMMKKDYYFLPFCFKGSEDQYVVIDYNILLSYIQMIHFFIEKYKLENTEDLE